TDARLDGARRLEEAAQRFRTVQALQRHEVHHARGGDLREGGQVALARLERGARLRIEADRALLAPLRRDAIELLRALHQAHLALVALDRQLVDFFARQLAQELLRQRHGSEV